MGPATQPELGIVVADSIAREPQLAEAVHRATERLRGLIATHELDPAERIIEWGECPGDPQTGPVRATLRERDEHGSRDATVNLSRANASDAIARQSAMNRLSRDVLRQRWYQIGQVIDRGISELRTGGVAPCRRPQLSWHGRRISTARCFGMSSNSIKSDFESYDLQRIRERVAVLEERAGKIENRLDETAGLFRQIAVMEDRVGDLRRAREESDRRYWQFVVLFVGGLLTLAINLVVTFVGK